MLAKLTSKNQITLPVEMLKPFDGVQYFEVREAEGVLELSPVRTQGGESALEKARRRFKEKGFDESTIAEAVKWARKHKK